MGGPAGILAAAQGASGVGKNYPGLREKLTTRLAATQTEAVRAYAEALKDGVHWLAYDIMHGVTGVLRVLMDEPSKDARSAVEATNGYLCSHILKRRESGLPGWWVPSELEPIAEDRETYPPGDLNLGMAHGVTGVVGRERGQGLDVVGGGLRGDILRHGVPAFQWRETSGCDGPREQQRRRE